MKELRKEGRIGPISPSHNRPATTQSIHTTKRCHLQRTTCFLCCPISHHDLVTPIQLPVSSDAHRPPPTPMSLFSVGGRKLPNLGGGCMIVDVACCRSLAQTGRSGVRYGALYGVAFACLPPPSKLHFLLVASLSS
jgi:hypothetical protein